MKITLSKLVRTIEATTFGPVCEFGHLISLLYRILRHRSFPNRVPTTTSKSITVLANGPSLKEVLDERNNNDKFRNTEFSVMNFFAEDTLFTEIRPKYYCLADPMFFSETYRIAKAKKLFSVLNATVTWEMYLFIPVSVSSFVKFSGITNKNIKIFNIGATHFWGSDKCLYKLMKIGWALPRYQSVVHLNIYTAICTGAKNVYVYGIDHNCFKNLAVTSDNKLCWQYMHYYDDSSNQYTPVLTADGDIFKIGKFLNDNSYMFIAHDKLAGFAEYMGVNVYNCTKGSWVDSYKRLN